MCTTREDAEEQAREAFQRMRETVAVGEHTYVAVRLAEYDANEDRWAGYHAAEAAKREHDIDQLRARLIGATR